MFGLFDFRQTTQNARVVVVVKKKLKHKNGHNSGSCCLFDIRIRTPESLGPTHSEGSILGYLETSAFWQLVRGGWGGWGLGWGGGWGGGKGGWGGVGGGGGGEGGWGVGWGGGGSGRPPQKCLRDKTTGAGESPEWGKDVGDEYGERRVLTDYNGLNCIFDSETKTLPHKPAQNPSLRGYRAWKIIPQVWGTRLWPQTNQKHRF